MDYNSVNFWVNIAITCLTSYVALKFKVLEVETARVRRALDSKVDKELCHEKHKNDHA